MLLRCLCAVAISTGLIGMWAGPARRLGFTVPLGPGCARARRAHGLRQGARGRATPSPVPSRGGARAASRSAAGITSTPLPPATPERGTAATSTKSPGSPHVDSSPWHSPGGESTRRTSGGGREPDYPGSVARGVAQLAERYVRNVEAVGSNPITSTKGPVQGPPWDPRAYKVSDHPRCAARVPVTTVPYTSMRSAEAHRDSAQLSAAGALDGGLDEDALGRVQSDEPSGSVRFSCRLRFRSGVDPDVDSGRWWKLSRPDRQRKVLSHDPRLG